MGGTANNYFKEFVDVKGKYAERGYVSENTTTVPPGLPFLILVVLGILGALGYVVAKTG